MCDAPSWESNIPVFPILDEHIPRPASLVSSITLQRDLSHIASHKVRPDNRLVTIADNVFKTQIGTEHTRLLRTPSQRD